MSYVISKAYLENKVQKISEDIGIDKDTAFLRLCYSVLFGKSFDDLDEEDVIEGSQEKQIDLIRIENDDENSAEINVVQCKNETGFSSNSIIQLRNGLEWVFEKPKEEYSKLKNINLLNKIREIREIMDKKALSNISLKIYFITKGDTNFLSDEFNQEKKSLDFFKNSGFKECEIEIWGAKELVDYINKIESLDKIINQKMKLVYDINNPSVIKTSIGNYKGIICTMKASEIARIIEEDSQGLIFDKNIRKFLGPKKRVNKSIYESCGSDKEGKIFWFLNNGITMVCDSFDLITDPDNPHIKTNNLQIINGCQTAKTLHVAYLNNHLKEETSVLVRLYSASEEEGFLDKIVLTTNNQNKIGVRDLKSNDNIQQNLQKVFLEKYGYTYERKVNEFSGKKVKNKMGNEKVAQAYLAFGRKLPSTARSQPNTIWGDEEIYEEVFGKSTPSQLLFCYKLYEFCLESKKKQQEKFKDSEEESDQISYGTAAYGTFHLIRVMGYLYLKSENFSIDQNLDEEIKKIELDKSILQPAYDNAFAILNEILEKNKDKYSTPTNFYKSHDIHSLINSKLKELSRANLTPASP